MAKHGKLEPFRAEVLQMRLEGVTYCEIHQRIKEKGYAGTQDAIRGFMSKEQRIQKDLQSIKEIANLISVVARTGSQMMADKIAELESEKAQLTVRLEQG